MRLIDADRMLLTINMMGTNKFGIFDEDIRKFLEEQRTIKAIPVEWIEKWMLDNWELECNYGIEQMIEDWEKENERQTDMAE